MKYSVIIQPQAEKDLAQAYHWLQVESPAHAMRWLKSIRSTIDSLKQFPKRSALAPDEHHFSDEVRQLLFGRRRGQYRVLFTVTGQQVHVLHVRHASRRK